MDKEQAQLKLKILNEIVENTIKERKDFLDTHMYLFAEFQIGDQVYNVETGRVTLVKEHYRFWADRDPYHDTSLYCDCAFANGDNTSRYSGFHPYVLLSEKENRTDEYLRRLESFARRR